jgi:spore germination cell wall hydrolase CwlJ-like protein
MTLAHSVTVVLPKAQRYVPGKEDDTVYHAYRLALSSVTTDDIVFESDIVKKAKAKVIAKVLTLEEKSWSPSYRHARAEQLLAGMLFGECRGQNLLCMNAVGHVALNRAKADLDARYGHGLWGVLNKRKAFSCLRTVDPNYRVIKAAMAGKLKPHSPDGIKWTIALGIAHQLMHRDLSDPTRGATFYFAKTILPKWIHDSKMQRVAEMDGHIFYKKN